MEKQENSKDIHEKFNKISAFLTKFIFKENFDSLKKAGFIDSFISDPEITKIMNEIDIKDIENRRFLFLLFNNKKLNKDDVTKIVNTLGTHERHIYSYDLINDYFMVVIEFPQEFVKDYDLILQGKYSKLSEEFKKSFPETKPVFNSSNIKIGLEYTIYYHIFNKTEWLNNFWLKKLNLVELDKNLELWEKPKENDIIFNINKLIKDE